MTDRCCAPWSTQQRWNLLAQRALMGRRSHSAVSHPVKGADPGPPAGRYATDGWDGCPVARQRLLQPVAERGLPGVVVLSGDVHTHPVAQLRANFDDERAPVPASEFCTGSISSHGPAQASVDAWMAHNPQLRYGRADQRGCIALMLDERQLQAELLAVDQPLDPASVVTVAARFVVDARCPGAQPA